MIENWKKIAIGAWSMWAFYALIILEALPPLAEAFAPWLYVSPPVLVALKVLAIISGGLLRLRRQKKLELLK